MLNNINISRYILGDSFIHRMNPLVKILCILLCILIVSTNHLIGLDIFMLLFLVVVLYLSKVPMSNYIQNIYHLKIFLLIIFIFNIIFNSSFLLTFQLLLKIIIVILYSQVLLFTTSVSDMIFSIELLLRPLKIFKINIRQISFCIGLSIVFIPVIINQFNTIIKSVKGRGINVEKGSIKQKLMLLNSIIVPMFILTLRKADVLAESLELRYDDKSVTTITYKVNISDIIILIIHVILIIIGVIL